MTGTEISHRGLQVVYISHIADMVMDMEYTKYIRGIYLYMVIYLVYTRHILLIKCICTMYIRTCVHAHMVYTKYILGMYLYKYVHIPGIY